MERLDPRICRLEGRVIHDIDACQRVRQLLLSIRDGNTDGVRDHGVWVWTYDTAVVQLDHRLRRVDAELARGKMIAVVATGGVRREQPSLPNWWPEPVGQTQTKMREIALRVDTVRQRATVGAMPAMQGVKCSDDEGVVTRRQDRGAVATIVRVKHLIDC